MTLPTVIGRSRIVFIAETGAIFRSLYQEEAARCASDARSCGQGRVSPRTAESWENTMNHIDVIPGLVTVTLIAVVGLVLVWLNNRNHREHPRPRASRSPRKVSTRSPRTRAPVPSRSQKSRGART